MTSVGYSAGWKPTKWTWAGDKCIFLLLDSKGTCAITGWGKTELGTSSCDWKLNMNQQWDVVAKKEWI